MDDRLVPFQPLKIRTGLSLTGSRRERLNWTVSTVEFIQDATRRLLAGFTARATIERIH
jgi:hypothetical protein